MMREGRTYRCTQRPASDRGRDEEFVAVYLGLNAYGEHQFSFRPEAGTGSLRAERLLSYEEVPKGTPPTRPRRVTTTTTGGTVSTTQTSAEAKKDVAARPKAATGKPAAAAKKTAAPKAAPKAAAKSNGAPKPAARAKYPDDVRVAVKLSNQIRGKSHGAGPKQHVHVREVVRAELKAQQAVPTPQNVAKLAGFGSVKDLRAAASGDMPRDGLKAMKPLASRMGDDPWCKGRHLAGALAAWAEQLKG